MKYFALFMQNDSFVEKCLILIKHIGSPGSKSLPHITVRIMPNADEHPEYVDALQQDTVDHIKVIRPDTFNMDTEGPYVVYLLCESDTLEENNYKPDFPDSSLHLTLYEGKDYAFAKALKDTLNQYQWNFKIVFSQPRALSIQTVGVKQPNHPPYNRIFEDVLGRVPDNDWNENNDARLALIDEILSKQEAYLDMLGTAWLAPDSSDRGMVLNHDDILIEDAEDGTIVHARKSSLVDRDETMFVTPPEYANEMACCALDAIDGKNRKIDFGDSSVGTGSLFIALDRLISLVNRRDGKNYEILSAIGIDVDIEIARKASWRCRERGLTVIHGDAIFDIDIGPKRNLIIVNPPYDRYHYIQPEYRERVREIAKEKTGIDIPRLAGLYVYHLLIMDKWLAEGGIGVWLLPSSFLYTKYGYAVRQYLTENVQLLRMHVYDETKSQFTNAMISTTIVVFRKAASRADEVVHVSVGKSIQKPYLRMEIPLQDFLQNMENWRVTIFCSKPRSGNAVSTDDALKGTIRFQDLFDIKRGLATGANTFFVMTRQIAVERKIPQVALKPLLPKARYLTSSTIEADEDGYPLVTPQLVLLDCDLDEAEIRAKYPQLYEYLQIAKEGEVGKRIIDRTLVEKRSPWYKQEQREPPLFLLTYMGRNKIGRPPLYFLLNKSKAVALNTYLLLYPKPWLLELLKADNALCERLLSVLDDSAQGVIAQRARVYSGGLQKLEPNELKSVDITGLPDSIIKAFLNSEINI